MTAIGSPSSLLTPPSVRPPVARRDPRVDIVKEDPEVTAYLDAENAYTDAAMKDTEAFQASLYDEMLARIKEDDASVPYRRGGHFYYVRTETGKQYPIYCRKAGSLEAPEEITLDLNALAVGHPFLALGLHGVGRRPPPGL